MQEALNSILPYQEYPGQEPEDLKNLSDEVKMKMEIANKESDSVFYSAFEKQMVRIDYYSDIENSEEEKMRPATSFPQSWDSWGTGTRIETSNPRS